MNVTIIGAGQVGGALGRRLAAVGHAVTFGVRQPAEVADLVAACPGARAAPPAEAVVGADVVFLAVPGTVALEVGRSLAPLAGQIVVDCNNPMRWAAGPVWQPPPEGSLAQALAAALPQARIVKGFNTFGAEFHGDPDVHGTATEVYLATDDAEARQVVAELARSAGFDPVDAGPLRNAAVLENLAMLWIHLATVGGQGRQFTFHRLRRAPG